MVEPGIRRATAGTTSRPEPQLFRKFFQRKEKQEKMQAMPEQARILQAWAFEVPSRAHADN